MIGSNLDIPIVYQDLATSSMGPMNIGFMGDSHLGGVKMKGQLDADKLEINHKKEEQDKKTLKIALIALGTIVGLSFMPSLFKKCKQLFGITPKPSKSNFSWASIKKGLYNITVKPAKAVGGKIKNFFTKTNFKDGLYNVTIKPLKAVGNGIKNFFGKFKKKP